MDNNNFNERTYIMSVFATFKRPKHSKVPASQYIKSDIKSEDEPVKEDTKPAEQPVTPPESADQ